MRNTSIGTGERRHRETQTVARHRLRNHPDMSSRYSGPGSGRASAPTPDCRILSPGLTTAYLENLELRLLIYEQDFLRIVSLSPLLSQPQRHHHYLAKLINPGVRSSNVRTSLRICRYSVFTIFTERSIQTPFPTIILLKYGIDTYWENPHILRNLIREFPDFSPAI